MSTIVFEIRFAEGTLRELLDVPVFHRRRVVEDIAGELSASPATPSRTRKLLVGVVSPWDRGRPVWQLRVGEYRVFYDVDPEQRRVTIQAIRRKGRKSTEEIPVKTVPLREAKQSLSGYVAHAQHERVLITKHGRPAALVIGVEGRDLEDILLSADPTFWELIDARRRQPTVSMADVRATLGIPEKPARPRKAARRGRRR